MTQGKITPNGVSLEKHENETIIFFTNLGKDIELIPPSNTPHAKRPDFIMDQIEWEMKSPQNTSKIVVERALHRALRQSTNIIIDLRRAKGKDTPAINHIEKCFTSSKKSKRLLIITKQNKLLDYNK